MFIPLQLLFEQGQFIVVAPVCLPSEELRWLAFACRQPLKHLALVTPTTLQQGQRMCGIKTAKLKELLIQRHQFTGKLLNAACQGKRVHGSALTFKEEKTPSGSVFVIFIKRSSFTPSTTRPQLQGNQMHLFSPEEWSSLTAAFNTLLVKCTHRVALFSYQLNKNARGNCSDTVMTRNIQICFKSRWQT